ncbi:uncharacterized protein BJ171DRAFT_485873 [Polychytrium aggregatum]|uniref:uncharacterized protein n=1 Tax=Polychytrium aggregatum TaxID=110093 RepID=UPI0022FDBFD1|nr:uncharacterized protein BJ171DRAFT_485873 [Polychytrium aggregatum]KAI9209247.1 hypothetical protein BJ171DRAFT_485873 [Polychytrium aggregatum]
MSSLPLYKVIVAADSSSPSQQAIMHGVELCQRVAPNPCRLIIIHVTALNPRSSLPYIDNMEKSFNYEIKVSEKQEIQLCKDFIERSVADKVPYDFVQIEGEGDVGPLIEEFVKESHPDTNMLVLGTRNLGTVQRWALGSVSDYCLHHVTCPVLIVKDTAAQ